MLDADRPIERIAPTMKGVPIHYASPSADGAPIDCDPTDVAGKTITIAGDPDNPNDRNFSLTIDSNQDVDILAVIEKYRHQIESPRTTHEQRRDLTVQIYDEARQRKMERARLQGDAGPYPSVTKMGLVETDGPPIPILVIEPTSTVPSIQLDVERPTMPTQSPVRRTRVQFVLAAGGSVVVSYVHVSIQGDSLVLVADEATIDAGMYVPPKSTNAGGLAPIDVVIDGLETPVRAFMITDPFVVEGKSYTVLTIDRVE